MLLSNNQNISIGRILVPLGAGLIILSTLFRAPAQAQTPMPQKPATSTFIVSANEGYGVIDCLTDGVACGRIVADAWCEAHGKGVALAFGLASDITGSTGVPGPKPAPGDVIITCKD